MEIKTPDGVEAAMQNALKLDYKLSQVHLDFRKIG